LFVIPAKGGDPASSLKQQGKRDPRFREGDVKWMALIAAVLLGSLLLLADPALAQTAAPPTASPAPSIAP
jgi:hypothetical protein